MKPVKRGLLGLFFLLPITALSQVPRKVVVEHFTNTRCSICANRNPGFYGNLTNFPEVIHFAYHPSSPYSSCVLNKHNVSGNDDRTKFYGVYGSTPRLVVQGKVLPASSDYTSPAIFNKELGSVSSLSIRIKPITSSPDSLVANVIVKRHDNETVNPANLVLIAVEDTIFYQAPNGEDEHYDVYRRTLMNEQLAIPQNEGDSIEIRIATAYHPDWVKSRMYVGAMIQDAATKDIIQAAVSKGEKMGMLSTPDSNLDKIQIWPNPVSNILNVSGVANVLRFTIHDALGKEITEGFSYRNRQIDVSALGSGIYYLSVQTSGGRVVNRFIKT